MAFIMSWHESEDEDGANPGIARLARFRDGLYCSLGMRRDAQKADKVIWPGKTWSGRRESNPRYQLGNL